MYTKKMNLKDKLVHHIPIQDAANVTDVFGIEVELEGRNLLKASQEILNFWGQHNDGSLRKLVPGAEAIEYISRTPYNIKQTEKSIQLLFNYLNQPGVTVFDSYRTSIHVHVNYAQETFRTVYCALVLSIILDELLVSQNGEHRIGNNFCLRMRDAMGQVVGIINSIENGHGFFGVTQHERYSSINFAALMKFGSIEYRSLECTTHEGRLMHWIGTCQAIKVRAREFKNPTEIIEQFSQLNLADWLRATLGPFATKYLQVDGFEQMLITGMRIAQDLAFCSSWNEGHE